ncbi:MAG: hypothetical protein HOP08_19810 [Cyclobacteriaceae bacterium]|nr:hypothetical protein [Cyclobacteriaceae bacterium]
MRLLIVILTTIIWQTTFGQIVNSLSADKTGMFYYSVDSLIKKIEKEKRIKKIILKADWSAIQDFPETIRSIKIVKQDKTKDYKTKDFGDNDVLFEISGLTIIRNQVTLSIGTHEKRGNGMTFFADGAYIFYFKYLPKTETYKLTQIKSGIRL